MTKAQLIGINPHLHWKEIILTEKRYNSNIIIIVIKQVLVEKV